MTNIPDYLHPARIEARGDVPMTASEKLDELTFLMGLGVTTRRAAEQLGETVSSLSYLAFANDRPGLGWQLEEDATAITEQDRAS